MQALEKIIELSVVDDHLRGLFDAFTSKDIRLLREDPYIWYNLNASLQITSQRALRVLSDSRNARISMIIGRICSDDNSWYDDKEDSMEYELFQYYGYVLCSVPCNGIAS